MKNKILYISKSIYPLEGGSVIITEKLAEQFTADEMVVLGGRKLFNPTINRKNGIAKFYTQLGDVNYKGRGDRFFVPIRYLLFPFLLFRIYRILKKEKCTYILATFPDIYFCYASYLIAKWTKTPFSTYFHNTYLENRPNGHRGFFAKKWQPKIFNLSEKIFVMSKGMEQFYAKKYGSEYNFVPLEHTFTEWPIYKSNIPSFDEEKIKLVMIGNINSSNAEATIRLLNTLKNDNRYEIYMYTSVPKLLLKSRGIDIDAINHMGYISDSDLIEELRKYHIGVITHGFSGGYSDIEYETIFPTRTIPFLLSGIPIFVHSPKKSFLSEFIIDNKCAELVTDKDSKKILDSIDKIVSDLKIREELAKNCKLTADQFYGPMVAKKLNSTLGMN